jgi:hypothetical protein
MKQYQDHDPIKDKGKAVPHPKRPTHYSYRGRGCGGSLTFLRSQIDSATRKANSPKAVADRGGRLGIFGILMAVAASVKSAARRPTQRGR